jgi:selenocysteine-specific elongation factor
MKGFGTVVTGTLVSGSIGKDEEVEIFPQKLRARVRGVQVHGAAAERAFAGERTALNIAAERAELERGQTMTAPGMFEPTMRADVKLVLLASARPLRNRSRVHLHCYTAETVAEVVLHGAAELRPGSECFAQLRLAQPMLLLPGDRFILRQFSPVTTIGGGRLLDAFPLKQPAESLAEFLAVLERGARAEQLAARVARRGGHGLSLSEAVREMGVPLAEVAATAKRLTSERKLIQTGERLIEPASFAGLCGQAQQALAEFHKSDPLSAGMGKQELREKLGLDAAPEIFQAALTVLAQQKKITIAGERVSEAGRGVVMTDEEAQSRRMIEEAFRSAGLRVPALAEVLAELKIDRGRAQKLVTLLLREKVLVKLADDLVFHQSALEELRAAVRAYKAHSQKIDVAQFKELTGVSRKYAIPLLEQLDREHVTRRAGNERIIL